MRKKPLEEMAPEEVLSLMDRADARALAAVRDTRKDIAAAAVEAAQCIRAGGRLIYVGAGTSGRLGVLDASECPPTFSSDPRQVAGVIAGGEKALRAAVEGAEDDREAGRKAIAGLRAGKKDMVTGISASGTTPYVAAALLEAVRRGAKAWLISCSPRGQGPSHAEGVKVINLPAGPEVIQGSTRLAAGTATKLALNRITTAAFVMLGKVHGDLMVDVMPTNAKLIKRAEGIIMELTGCDGPEAAELLRKSGNRPKVAVLMKAKDLTKAAAERLLRENGGFLRRALN